MAWRWAKTVCILQKRWQLHTHTFIHISATTPNSGYIHTLYTYILWKVKKEALTSCLLLFSCETHNLYVRIWSILQLAQIFGNSVVLKNIIKKIFDKNCRSDSLNKDLTTTIIIRFCKPLIRGIPYCSCRDLFFIILNGHFSAKNGNIYLRNRVSIAYSHSEGSGSSPRATNIQKL